MKNNIFTNFIVVLSVVIAILFVAYYVAYGKIFATGQHVFDLSQKIQQASATGSDIKSSSDSLNTLMPKINMVDAYFIPAGGEVSFIDGLENSAKAVGLSPEINSVQLTPTSDISAQGFEYLSLKFSVSGSWANVYKFIALLPNFPYQITLDQADISSLSDGTSSKNSVWQGAFAIRVLEKSQ
jgi:Tfp pilus assembly protein PilO